MRRIWVRTEEFRRPLPTRCFFKHFHHADHCMRVVTCHLCQPHTPPVRFELVAAAILHRDHLRDCLRHLRALLIASRDTARCRQTLEQLTFCHLLVAVPLDHMPHFVAEHAC